MATPETSSPAISRALQDVLIEVKHAAKLMGNASEKLSNVGVDKLNEELRKSLKTRQLLNDAEADAIKVGGNAKETARKLAKTLEALENQYEAIRKIEEAAEKQKKRTLKSAGAAGENPTNIARAKAAQKAYIKAKLEEIDLTEAQADNIKHHIPLIRQETESRAKSIASTDGLRKMHEGLTSSIGDQIKGFASFSVSVALLKKAFFNSYDTMHRLTSVGMLGTFQTLQLMAPKLLISAQELEEILSKNRDIINQFGGGLQGVEKFGQEIQNVRSELKYLGENATKAAAQFIQLSKKSGLTPKDGVAYRKNLNQSIESFKQFSAMFGDTPEQYASLMEAMQDEENIRQRLNNLSKSQLAIELEEQRQRAYNLKLLGLSNEQIVDFNKRISNVFDQKKSGQVGERQKQALLTRQSVMVMIAELSKGSPEEQALAKQLQEKQASIGNIANAYAVNNQNGKKLAEADPEAARAYAKAHAAMMQRDIAGLEVLNKTVEGGGSIASMLNETGSILANRKAQGGDIKGQNTPDQLKKLEEKNRKELLADQSANADALVLATTAWKGIKTILEQPFAQAILGVVTGLWAFNSALGIKGILGALGTLGSGIKGVVSMLIGTRGLMGILGRLGALGAGGAATAAGGAAAGAAVAGAGAVAGGAAIGYTIGEYAVNPVLNKGLESITGQKGENSGTALYSGIDKMQGMGYFPGQSDTQKQQQSEQKAWQNSYQKKISTQGSITKKQADMYVSNGVKVDTSKIDKPVSSSSATMPYDFASFAQKVGQRESAGRYGIMGGSNNGYAGKYQFGALALESVGLLKKGASAGGNKALQDPSNWTIPGGLPAFLANGQMQEDAFKNLTNQNFNALKRAGVINSNTPPAEIAGYLASSHLVGAGNAIKMARGGSGGKDAFGTDAKTYFALGAASQPMSTPKGISAPGPGGQAAAVASASTTATSVAASVGTGTNIAASTGNRQDPQIAELKAQTALLATIAQNTANRISTSVNPNAYKQDTALVMGGVAG